MNEIIIISLLIGLIFAPLGCVVLWKRYIYYGDGLAHASILAGVVSIIMNIPLFYAGIVVTIFFAVAIFKFRLGSGNNAAIGLTSSVMISLALVLNSIYPGSTNIFTLLFGDIISVSYDDVPGLTLLLFAVVIFMLTTYRSIILMAFNRDIAFSRGIKVNILEFCFLTLLSFAILYTINIVGALLVTSIIIIPAMCGRLSSSTPLMMIISSIFYVILMNLAGVVLSFSADLPFAPTIVLCGGGLFLTIFACTKLRKKFLDGQQVNR